MKYCRRNKHYLNFPQQLDIPFVGDEAHCETNARTADTTHSTDSMDVVGHEVRKVVVNYMKGLRTTEQSNQYIIHLVCYTSPRKTHTSVSDQYGPHKLAQLKQLIS